MELSNGSYRCVSIDMTVSFGDELFSMFAAYVCCAGGAGHDEITAHDHSAGS